MNTATTNTATPGTVGLCRVCKHDFDVRGYVESEQERLLSVGICPTDDFWAEKWALRGHPDVLRIKGEHYMLTDNKLLSFDARNRKVRMLKTGEVISLNRLSHQGTIPDNWWRVLPDNAEWLEA